MAVLVEFFMTIIIIQNNSRERKVLPGWNTSACLKYKETSPTHNTVRPQAAKAGIRWPVLCLAGELEANPHREEIYNLEG